MAIELKKLQKFIRLQEMKIDDLEEEVKRTTDKKESKNLQAKILKLKEDEKLKSAIDRCAQLESEIKKASLIAAVVEDEAPQKKLISANKAAFAVQVEATDESVMKLINATIRAGEKDKTQARTLRQTSQAHGLEKMMQLNQTNNISAKIDTSLNSKELNTQLGGLRMIKALSWCSPLVVPKIPALIGLFMNVKCNKQALESAVAIVNDAPSQAIPMLILPHVWGAVTEPKKWKLKAAGMELMAPCTERMVGSPKQLATLLSELIPICVDASKEIRNEIRDAAQNVLSSVGRCVANPEIRALSDDVIKALVDPTNQKLTQDVLMVLGSTTFMNYVDANALALLCPILVRALREREQKSKKWAAQILGSCVKLVKEIDFIVPYFPLLLPLIKSALVDPTPEVQREAGKTIAQLSLALPELYQTDFKPFLTSLLMSHEENERTGSAQAISQIHFALGKDSLVPILNECFQGVTSSDKNKRHSYYELLDMIPGLFKEEYAPFIPQTIVCCLKGCLETDDHCRDAANRGASSLISFFGPLAPETLFPYLRDAYFNCVDNVDRQLMVFYINQLVSKILEHKRYQQDLLTTDIGPVSVRQEIAALLFMVWKGDSCGVCVRNIAMSWKNSGGSPKMLMSILPTYRALFKAMLAIPDHSFMGDMVGKVKAALIEMKGGCSPEDLELEVSDKDIPNLLADLPMVLKSKGKVVTLAPKLKRSNSRCEEHDMSKSVAHARNVYSTAMVSVVSELPTIIRDYVEGVTVCALTEGPTGSKVKAALVTLISPFIPIGKEVTAMIEEMYADTEETDDNDGEELFRVENMMLMYGGGHLLLKDTTLRMCRGRRYGVIGHNGAGKTTLMKQLAAGNVANMPSNIVCQHVSDAELGDLKVLEMKAIDFVRRDAPKGVNIETALEDVNFPPEMHDKLVSDLSGGWRMRLILARAMMKNADVLLLDEPTNHLDVQAIAWLEEYLQKQNHGSMMIISHEASFLNKVCTDIIQYKDKKLHYFRGDFDDFKRSAGISSDDVEALLKGDLNLDEDAESSEADENVDENVIQNKVVSKAKLTFPIPGKLSGISSSSKAVMQMKNVNFAYDEAKGFVLKGIDCRLTTNSRVAIVGRNGAGKSTLMSLLCRELNPTEVEGSVGEVYRHHNLRLAFIAQHHMETLGKFYQTTPYQYLQHRFQNGYDEELQRHLLAPRDDDEAALRKELGKKYGKYGLEVGAILGRTMKGKTLMYEVQWLGLTDSKQNTWEPLSKLRKMGVERFAIACDERIQAAAAGNDQRAVTRREVLKHLEQFGIDEEMCCNRNIGSFSAGQKSKLALGAVFWTKPHLVALDEPTNYLDPETVDALARALKWFRGGVVVITHHQGFIDQVCNEAWRIADGKLEVEKLNPENKRFS